MGGPMKERFEGAETFPDFLEAGAQNRKLWQEIYRASQAFR